MVVECKLRSHKLRKLTIDLYLFKVIMCFGVFMVIEVYGFRERL